MSVKLIKIGLVDYINVTFLYYDSEEIGIMNAKK